MHAPAAAIPFKNSEVATAVSMGNERIIKSGEKISPPPRPTIVSIMEIKNMKGRSAKCDMRTNIKGPADFIKLKAGPLKN